MPLSNLQVFVGGQNDLQSTLEYVYEHFWERVNLCEQLTSSDFGVSTGLINQNYWEKSKWYDVNVQREMWKCNWYQNSNIIVTTFKIS